MAGSPVIGRRRGAFLTLLWRPGLRASSDGVLATKSERKMLASRPTCLYSLYAWLSLLTSSSTYRHCHHFHITVIVIVMVTVIVVIVINIASLSPMPHCRHRHRHGNCHCCHRHQHTVTVTITTPSSSSLSSLLLRPRERWRSTVMSTSVCLSTTGTTQAIFTSISVHVAYGHGLVLLQQGDKNPDGKGQFWGFSYPLTMHCTA